jgi:hypothetical protein
MLCTISDYLSLPASELYKWASSRDRAMPLALTFSVHHSFSQFHHPPSCVVCGLSFVDSRLERKKSKLQTTRWSPTHGTTDPTSPRGDKKSCSLLVPASVLGGTCSTTHLLSLPSRRPERPLLACEAECRRPGASGAGPPSSRIGAACPPTGGRDAAATATTTTEAAAAEAAFSILTVALSPRPNPMEASRSGFRRGGNSDGASCSLTPSSCPRRWTRRRTRPSPPGPRRAEAATATIRHTTTTTTTTRMIIPPTTPTTFCRRPCRWRRHRLRRPVPLPLRRRPHQSRRTWRIRWRKQKAKKTKKDPTKRRIVTLHFEIPRRGWNRSEPILERRRKNRSSRRRSSLTSYKRAELPWHPSRKRHRRGERSMDHRLHFYARHSTRQQRRRRSRVRCGARSRKRPHGRGSRRACRLRRRIPP